MKNAMLKDVLVSWNDKRDAYTEQRSRKMSLSRANETFHERTNRAQNRSISKFSFPFHISQTHNQLNVCVRFDSHRIIIFCCCWRKESIEKFANRSDNQLTMMFVCLLLWILCVEWRNIETNYPANGEHHPMLLLSRCRCCSHSITQHNACSLSIFSHVSIIKMNISLFSVGIFRRWLKCISDLMCAKCTNKVELKQKPIWIFRANERAKKKNRACRL